MSNECAGNRAGSLPWSSIRRAARESQAMECVNADLIKRKARLQRVEKKQKENLAVILFKYR